MTPVVARWSRSSASGRSGAARASSGWRAIERAPPRTARKMADALRAVAPGRRCWWLLLLQRTRSPQTSASLAVASAGAASQRQTNNSSSSCPAVCWGGLPLSLSPQKTCLLGGTFRSPGRTEKRKVVPSLSLPSLSLPSSSYSLGRLFTHLTQLHAKPCGCGGGCGMARTSEAAGEKVSSVRLLHSFLSLPLPLLFFAFILSQEGEKSPPNLNKTRLECQTVAFLKGLRSWTLSGWAAVLILALLLEMVACREDGSLGHGPAEKMVRCSLPPDLLAAGEGCSPVQSRVANTEQNCPSLMMRRRLFLASECSLLCREEASIPCVGSVPFPSVQGCLFCFRVILPLKAGGFSCFS